MKILFLAPANSIHTVRWVNALAERGHQVVLASKKDHQEKKDIIQKRVRVIYLPFTGTKGYYLNGIVLHSICKKEKFDVVNVHYASGYGTLARVSRLPEIILNVWGSDVYEFPYQSKLKEIILRRNLVYAAKLVSTSHSMAKQTERFLTKKKKIGVIPFGVDIQNFKMKYRKEVERDADIKKRSFVFGMVKMLSPKYGVSTVIEAFGAFLQKLQEKERGEVRLEIYGKGELLEELKTLAIKLDIEKQVYFGGYVENKKVPSLLNQMDVFLLGSKSESFGVAAVEAMSCGLPVIATRASGFQEVVEDGKTGFLVPVGDFEEMAERMFQLYHDAKLRRSLGVAGRQRVKKLYDWDKNVDAMIKIYGE